MPGVDWGSVPDWLAGLGAISALLFARSAVKAAQATNRQQTAQIRALEESEERRRAEATARYATRFVCWISGWESEPDLPAVVLVNSNDVPLYQVTIYVGTPLGCAFAPYVHVGPTEGRRRMGRPTRALRTLVDGQDFVALRDSGALWTAMTFRDANGHWWSRSPIGLLWPAEDEASAHRRCRDAITALPGEPA
ncbi:hypothetical protein GCM10023321_65370 [Pseudonocardia eucalypti]|uniref:Uncharacterized protein n=1 Tax=Pseudonocardia eucalypti TaxID=648755 RepID=A0ABP9QZ56_9PSEU|nr:hypothetical protein [Pseudonocardia eucalypti]